MARNCAVVISWLSMRVIDWGGVPYSENRSPNVRTILPFQREIAVILVAGVAVAVITIGWVLGMIYAVIEGNPLW